MPDLKLGTLARHLRVSVSPCHRALADAAATAEVLHALLERAGTFGVLGLDDLLALPSIRAHPSASKLRLTARLPRRPGVYLMKDRGGRILYVGKATNLRARVRSYFGGDDRRKVPQLLRETEAIDWIECPHELEASVRELRLIQELEPRFNRQGKRWRSTAYVKLTLTERFPRLTVVRSVKADGNLYLGPFASTRAAHTVREAIETAAPLRRCTVRTGRTKAIVVDAPCAPAQLGVACCPCRGYTAEADYAAVVETVRRGLTEDPRLLLDPLERRMHVLAEQERFEEAAITRDRVAALTRVLRRRQTLAWLSSSGRMSVAVDDGVVTFVDGRLLLGDPELDLTAPPTTAPDRRRRRGTSVPAHLDRRQADELLVVARWLDREVGAGRARLLEASGSTELTACAARSPATSRRRAGGSAGAADPTRRVRRSRAPGRRRTRPRRPRGTAAVLATTGATGGGSGIRAGAGGGLRTGRRRPAPARAEGSNGVALARRPRPRRAGGARGCAARGSAGALGAGAASDAGAPPSSPTGADGRAGPPAGPRTRAVDERGREQRGEQRPDRHQGEQPEVGADAAVDEEIEERVAAGEAGDLGEEPHDERTEHERDDPQQDPHRQAHRCGADLVLRSAAAARRRAPDRARPARRRLRCCRWPQASRRRGTPPGPSAPARTARTGTRRGRRPRRGGA